MHGVCYSSIMLFVWEIRTLQMVRTSHLKLRVGQAVNNVFGSRTYVVNSRVGIEVHSLTIRISKGTNRMDRSYRVGPKYTAVLQLRNHSANVVDDDDFKYYRRTVRCGECCCTPLCSLSHVRNGAILRCAWRQLRRPPDSQL